MAARHTRGHREGARQGEEDDVLALAGDALDAALKPRAGGHHLVLVGLRGREAGKAGRSSARPIGGALDGSSKWQTPARHGEGALALSSFHCVSAIGSGFHVHSSSENTSRHCM